MINDDAYFLTEIGKAFQRQREKLDLSITDVASLCALRDDEIHEIELGRIDTDVILFVKLLSVLKISAAEIFGTIDSSSKLD